MDAVDPAGDTSVDPTDSHGVKSLWMSLLVILVSEVGDKTFLISAVMAMRNPRLLIFAAAMSALAVMTVLSAALGHVVPNLISKQYTQFAAACLFVVFGVKMLLEGYKMTGKEGQQELDEVTHELIAKEDTEKQDGMERGDGEKDKGGAGASPDGKQGLAAGFVNLINYLFTPVFVQTFVLTFFAEWGDRSQIASIAVVGGRLLAAKISVRTVTILGAILFIIFGLMAFIEQAFGER
ncbi:hypothetical protein HK101_007521 [Irineochytrium annulatum]|nr:hypothetical protein HK101_007521 [Irineochytrium annulatum]